MEKALHLFPHTPNYGHHYHQSFSRHLGHESYGLQPGKLNSAVYSRTLLFLTEKIKLIFTLTQLSVNFKVETWTSLELFFFSIERF